MMLVSNGNIDQLINYLGFIVDEFDFMKLIEKESLIFKMKRLTKMKCECEKV